MGCESWWPSGSGCDLSASGCDSSAFGCDRIGIVIEALVREVLLGAVVSERLS